jgi:hypothetical protein
MSDTLDATRNGHTPKNTPAGGAPAPAPATGPKGKPLPDTTKADLDLNHRLMVEEYIGWYYPGRRPALDDVVNEMVGIAWGLAKKDQQRPETADERSARLTGQS